LLYILINENKPITLICKGDNMNILNFTPHPINIICGTSVIFNKEIRKYVSTDPKIIKTITSSGMLSVKYEICNGASIDGIPIRIKKMTGIDPIPQGADIGIVSGLYASATKDDRAYSIIDPVFEPTGKRVIGSLGIGKVNN